MTIAGYAIVAATSAFASFGMAVAISILFAGLAAVLTERIAFRPVRGRSLATMLLS